MSRQPQDTGRKVTTGPDFVRSVKYTANVIGVCEKTLKLMIARGEGPKVIQISRMRIGIRDSDREAWIESRVRESDAA
jgi:predicted DNA-binding transcriptional regulator AlpA